MIELEYTRDEIVALAEAVGDTQDDVDMRKLFQAMLGSVVEWERRTGNRAKGVVRNDTDTGYRIIREGDTP